MRTYITELKINGIKNIDSEQTLSFHNIIRNQNFDINKSNIKAIYGPNGAGKSAIIHAMQIYDNIVSIEGYLNDKSVESYLTELINYRTKNFFVEVSFITYNKETKKIRNNQTHSIELTVRDSSIYISSEKLVNHKVPGNKFTKEKTIFEVANGELLKNEFLSDTISERTKNLLSKRSLVEIYLNDIYNPEDKDDNSDDIFELFPSIFLGFNLKTFIEEEDKHSMFIVQKRLSEEKFLKVQNNSSNKIDTETVNENVIISAYTKEISKENLHLYEYYINKLTKFIRIFKNQLLNIELEKKEKNNNYIVERYFCYNDYKVNIEFESNGIKKLIRIFDAINDVTNGKIVFFDELDANINDVYLGKLLEYIADFTDGQLVFTSHNLSPMSVLKNRKHSIDFISTNGEVVKWTKNGNSTPNKLFVNGMIRNLPFNIESFDFIEIFGDSDV